MRKKALFSLVGALIAAIALVSGSGAATTKAQQLTRIDVSTRAAVVHYLKSIHVKAKGAVIQRGLRNYAGAHCPGKGWNCASTRHLVVQIATRGGQNRFVCRSASCAVVQLDGASHGVYIAGRRLQSTNAPTATNTATCIKTSGLSQSCTINQSSTTKNNKAVIYESVFKNSGLVQTASATASITQQSSASGATNTACVNQTINVEGSTTLSGKKAQPINVALEAHQSITISQDAPHGANDASKSANSNGSCDLGHMLNQSQTLTSKAGGSGAGSVTQNEDAVSNGANLSLDIEQNQGSGFGSADSLTNNATFAQNSNLQAVAFTTSGATVNQTQSTSVGGIVGTVNQDSHGVSTADAHQTELQCEDADVASTSSPCSSSVGSDPLPATLNQTQVGPVRKGDGTSSQTGGNSGDTFMIHQTSTQSADTGSTQSNTVQGDCHTDGNCTENQTTTVDGQTTTNTQSGQDLNSSINCTGSTCTPTVPPAPSIDSKPPNPSNSSFAEFTFSDTQEGVSFLCQIDDGAFSACSSPQDYFDLADGSHTFSVEAKDADGNVSPSASYTWLIDTAPVIGTNDDGEVTADNVDLAEFGYGGMRAFTGGDNPTGDGTGSISVTGVTGTVLKALLFWNGPTNSEDPASNADVSFADTGVAGTNIGTASSNCWGPGAQGPYTNSQSYEADVTNLVTGNGSYDLSDFTKSGDTTSDINGVALVVFYHDGDGSNNRNVVLWSGNDSNIAFGDDPAGWDETLTGVPGSSFDGSLDLVVSDGQSFADDGVLVNGTSIVGSGSVFQGDSTPAGPANADGDLWDVKSFDLPASLLTSASNALEVTSGAGSDCLSLVAAAANVPAAAQMPVVLAAPRHQPALQSRQSPATIAGFGTSGGFIRRK